MGRGIPNRHRSGKATRPVTGGARRRGYCAGARKYRFCHNEQAGVAHFGRRGVLRRGTGGHGRARGRHPRRPRARAGLAAGASAALHRRHQRQAAGPAAAHALSRPCRGPRRAIHLSRPRPARGLRHARPAQAPPGRAALRLRPRGMDHPHPRPLQRDGRTPRRPGRRLGGPARQAGAARRPAARGQDRRHRRAHPPLGVVPRHSRSTSSPTCRTTRESCPAASPTMA